MAEIRFLDPSSRGSLPDGHGARLLVLEEGLGAVCARHYGAQEINRRELLKQEKPIFYRAYVDMVSALNRFQNSPEWWALSFPGRVPLSSPLVRRCFKFYLIARQAAALSPQQSLWVVSCDRVLARSVAAWASGLDLKVVFPAWRAPDMKTVLARVLGLGPWAGFFQAAWALVTARLTLRPALESGRSYCALFTLISPRSFANRRYEDVFFGPLGEYLQSKGQSLLFFGPVISHRRRSLSLMAGNGKPLVLPMEYFASLGDLWSCLKIALERRARGFALPSSVQLLGLDVSGLVAEDIRDNVGRSRYFSDLWYRFCAKALLRRVSVATLYYPFENMARERMLVTAFREISPGTALVGYQHAAVTPSHFNLMVSPREIRVLPLPDRVVTMGNKTRDFLARAGGLSSENLQAACALRQNASVLPRPYRPWNQPLRLLVALATSVEESAGVLKLLQETFADSNGPEIAIRPHPAIPLAWGLARAGAVTFSYREAALQPLEEIWAWADSVAYVSSTLGLEAVHRGIPVVRLDIGDLLDTDPLFELKSLKWEASDPASLRRALEEIASLDARALKRLQEGARAFSESYCLPVTSQTLGVFLNETPASR